MKKLTTTICLTLALVMGFNTASSSQGFEAGKSYIYNEALPDTDYVVKLVIEIGKGEKTYKATILSGNYKYTCPKGKILSQEKLEAVKCQNIVDKDAKNFLIGGDELTSPIQLLQGSLKEPTRVITVLGVPSGGDIRFNSMDKFDKTYYFEAPKLDTSLVVTAKPKAKRTPPRVKKDPLAQKLVTLKTLLKGGLITQKDYNTKRAATLKEMSRGKVDPIVRKLKKIQQLLDQKLITPADATYKRRQILDGM